MLLNFLLNFAHLRVRFHENSVEDHEGDFFPRSSFSSVNHVSIRHCRTGTVRYSPGVQYGTLWCSYTVRTAVNTMTLIH